MTSIEIKWFRSTIGYTLFDHKINELLEELKVQPVYKKLKSNWLQHVTRMNKNIMPKIRLKRRSNEDHLEDL